MSSQSRSADVIIIGAGPGGLGVAKTYLELEPTADILLLEQRATLGGVWAAENCYDSLKTNNLKGTYEYSDEYGVEENTHVPGAVLHQYLSDFAAHFDLVRRIHFSTKVISVAKSESGWKINSVAVDSAGEVLDKAEYQCKKLVVCTGLFSTPNPVTLRGKDDFGKPVLNQGQMNVEAHAVAKDPNVKRVTVISACKAGYDAVHLMASHGKKVDWVIRESGGGAVWMSEPKIYLGPWTIDFETVANMRFFSWFSPCVWGDIDGFGPIRKFLHSTPIGRWLVLFWSTRVGILNYPGNFHDYITSGQVRVIKKDISHLSAGGKVHLADGSVLQSDALFAITGWNLAQSIRYHPAGLEASLGVPTANLTAEETAFWNDLDHKADEEMRSRFPSLRHGPAKPIPYKQAVSPFRLYHGIAPPGLTARGDRSIVFVDMIHSIGTMIIIETQALWAYAYLNNKLDLDKKKEEDIYWQTALMSRYGKVRYPCGFGAWFFEFAFDTLPYADMLLEDLGLKKRRKGSWLKEVFEGHTTRDYKGINQEWMQKQLAKKEQRIEKV
ncbi:hypothetical protein DV738_g3544, partial [Chaetothyriales sp. CBS 135597]